MNLFFIQQMDFVFVLYGAAFITMCVLVGALRNSRSPDLRWGWLQAFGIVHGLCEWTEALTHNLPDRPLILAIHNAILLLSFVLLLEFGRRGATPTRQLGIWIYLPILAAAAFSLLPNCDWLLRFGIGLPAIALTAWALWSAARLEGSGSAWLRRAALLFACYALLAGVIVADGPQGPARFLNYTNFFRLTGLPVQLFRLLTMVGIATCLWQLTVQRVGRRGQADNPRVVPLYLRSIVFTLLIVLSLGWLITEQLGRWADSDQRTHLLARARAVAATLIPEQLTELTGEPEQEMTRPHRLAVQTLTKVKRISPDVAQVYLYAPQQNHLIFYACSMSDQPNEYYPAGLVCEGDLDDQDWSFFEKGEPYVTGPFRDRWGEWISAIVPALRAADGQKVLLALGMDVPAHTLRHEIRHYRSLGLFLTMALTLLVLDFFSRQRRFWLAAQRLATSEAGLRHLSAELEQHVQQRTADLAATNRALQEEVDARRASELKLRTLTDQLPAITYTVTLKPRPHTTFISPHLHDMLGYTQEKWLANPDLWIQTLHPDDRKRVVSEVEEKNQTGAPFDLECRHVAHDGSVRWFRNTARFQCDKEGVPTHAHGVMLDITDRIEIAQELRETGKRYRLLLDHAPVGIFHFDQNLILTRSNQRFADILKTDQHKMLGLNLRKLKDPSVLPALEDALQGNMGHFEGLYRATTSNTEVWISMNTGPVLDRDGRTAGGVGIVEDISDRRRSEEERNRNQKLESLGLLAGGIAHDFNNILTSILGNITLLKQSDHESVETKREILAEAEHAALRARDLTQQLLTFAKGGTPVKRLTRLDVLIQETVSFAIHGSASRCEMQIAPDLWPAEVDASQIAQVI